MVEYTVIISPYFKKEFYKLPKELQRIARKELDKLQYKLIGEPLKYELRGFYSIHFFRNKYRIIYSKEENILKVLVLQIGKRTDDFYKKLKDELKRRSLQLRQGNTLSLLDLS